MHAFYSNRVRLLIGNENIPHQSSHPSCYVSWEGPQSRIIPLARFCQSALAPKKRRVSSQSTREGGAEDEIRSFCLALGGVRSRPFSILDADIPIAFPRSHHSGGPPSNYPPLGSLLASNIRCFSIITLQRLCPRYNDVIKISLESKVLQGRVTCSMWRAERVHICRKICGLGCVTPALVHAWFTQPGPRIFLHFCM